jgi:hypothetical protein
VNWKETATFAWKFKGDDAWLTLTLSAATPPDPVRIALVGAGVAGAYALVGAILTQWLPEPESGVEH